MDAVKCLGRG